MPESPEPDPKRTHCETIIRGTGRALVAYSGGIDSTLVARLAHDLLGDNAAAATAVSPSLAKADLDEAVAVTRAIGIRHILIESAETDDPLYRQNTPQRCYVCKSTAYHLFTDLAAKENFHHVLDGTNADDTGDHRPGRQAAREHGVRSPLQEAGLTKAEIRAWAAELGLPNWDKPANACLSSRVPFGSEVTPAKLAQIEAAESALRALGFRQCRVRHHGQVARIEVASSDLARALAHKEAISSALKSAGFLYVTLDLDGFRSGSLNEALAPVNHVPA
jgi:uncharacterized protein